MVFQENSEKSLQASQQGPVNHKRAMSGAVGSDVAEVEPFRHIEIELNGTELPRPANGVLHDQIDLRTIKRAVPGIQLVRNPGFLQGFFQGRFGDIPVFFVADTFCGPGAQKEFKSLESKRAKNIHAELQHFIDFRRHLLRSAEKMRVILCESAHSSQTVKHTALFKSI